MRLTARFFLASTLLATLAVPLREASGDDGSAALSQASINEVSPPATVTHFAGSLGPGFEDGTGSAARFSGPTDVASDSAGNVYVADLYNHTIRKMTPGGVVTTLAGLAGSSGSADGTGSAARFYYPHGVATDSAGIVYVADQGNNTIRKVTPGGAVTTIAGLAGFIGSADGMGSAARFYYPEGVATDSAGNVYVADAHNHTIRKVTPGGVVTTLSGLAGSFGSADGTGSVARFYHPSDVATDSAGFVYITDSWNNTIRKVTPGGVVTTLVGLAGSSGSADGTGTAARFSLPYGVATDSAGNVYAADANNNTIRKVTPGAVVTTLAGLPGSLGSADGAGSAARFSWPSGVATDAAGNVYVADFSNSTIRKVTPGGVVTTLAGLAGSFGSADGTGTDAGFYYPGGVATDSAGNVYVAEDGNNTIRKVTPGGVVTTLAGLAGSSGSADGTGSAARFRGPWSVATDSAGNVYVADSGNHTIRKVTPGGVVTTLAGLAGYSGGADGTGSAARFNYPLGVATDSAGNVYVADDNNHTIRKATPGGVVTTLAGLAGSSGSADGAGSAARFYYPAGVATDSAGNVYVADFSNSTIRKVTPGGMVTTLAGLAGSSGSADGTGSAARFLTPAAVATDSAGNVYVADQYNSTIRKVTPGGVVTTLAGLAGSHGSTDGMGNAARFYYPSGVSSDPSGTLLYVADWINHSIRLVSPGLADVAIIDVPIGPVGTPRQLDTAPQTATSWQWSVIRQPAASAAALSSSAIRNPTFTPDVPDLFIFRLDAANAAGVRSITTVEIAVSCASSPLSAPTLLSATEGCASIDLDWAASAGAAGYNVYRAEGACGGIYAEIAWGIVGTSYSDNNAALGVSYAYIVRAHGGYPSCESMNSNCMIGVRTTAIFFGDFNEDTLINASDSVIFSNFLVGNLTQGSPPFTAPLGAADVNADTAVNAVDAVILANYLVGNIACLPN